MIWTLPGEQPCYARVLLNNGNGVFTDSGQSLGMPMMRDFGGAGDIDGDGDLDALVTNYQHTNACGSTTEWQLQRRREQPASVQQRIDGARDLDSDGDLDVVITKDGVGDMCG